MKLRSDIKFLQGLLEELRKLPKETAWVEFKHNKASPDDIGEYLSALSNVAALEGKASAYLVWGIEDQTHNILGTSFDPGIAKKGNEELENWLVRLLNPHLHFKFHSFEYQGVSIVILEIPRAHNKPTSFNGVESIRVGSCRQKLKEHPQLERDLWRVFDRTPFESVIAKEFVDSSEVLRLLDYPSYFDLLERPLPENRDSILEALEDDRMIETSDTGWWNITNLGAVLFARSLNDFASLGRKSIRVIVYDGPGRMKTKQEQLGQKGYASGFEGLIDFVNALLPRNEIIGKALR